MKIRNTIKTTAALLGILLPALALAQPMTSTNYQIPFDDLSAGGGTSSSTNYALSDTIAEVSTPSGEGMTSANYKACAGFQCLESAAYLTAVITTSPSPCTATTTGTPPYIIPLGTLSTSSVITSSTHICVRASTNTGNTTTASVYGAHGGLASTSVPSDVITSNTTTLTAGIQGYGICGENAANGFSTVSPFNGSCSDMLHGIGGVTTSQQTIFTGTGTLANAYGDVRVKASAAGSTPAHNDYADTLTFIVTATY